MNPTKQKTQMTYMEWLVAMPMELLNRKGRRSLAFTHRSHFDKKRFGERPMVMPFGTQDVSGSTMKEVFKRRKHRTKNGVFHLKFDKIYKPIKQKS